MCKHLLAVNSRVRAVLVGLVVLGGLLLGQTTTDFNTELEAVEAHGPEDDLLDLVHGQIFPVPAVVLQAGWEAVASLLEHRVL